MPSLVFHLAGALALFSSSAPRQAADAPPGLEAALERVPAEESAAMRWLLERMPASDRLALTPEYLLANSREAHAAWRAAPWHEAVPREIFLDAVLPYASVNERRDEWRPDFRARFTPLVAEAKTPGEAALILNREVFPRLKVKYSTERAKPDQSPFESMESGLASCTGLSILLIDACRAVGVPARFVGTALWSDGSGNHSWVEVWDEGDWHFLGAAEPAPELDRAWFVGRASQASREDPRHAIYATTWRRSPLAFPMVWRPDDRSVRAVDVTDRYTRRAEPLPPGHARVRLRVLDASSGARVSAELVVARAGDAEPLRVRSKDERFDANDHATVVLPLGARVTVDAVLGDRRARLETSVERDEQLVTLRLD